MTETDGKRVLCTEVWEEIHIRPSIDLISDEYERKTNNNFLLEMVRDSNDKDAEDFLKLMELLGYQINEINVEDMNPNTISSWMNEVLKKVKSLDCDGVMIVFSQFKYNKAVMQDIWTKFTSKECPELRDKPKIFIFLTIPQPKTFLQADISAFTPKWAGAYETPSEADILIIQDKLGDDGVNFLSEFTAYIDNYGDKEHIFTLASVSPNSPPLLISTMTRKFFVKLHHHRGHHLDIHNGSEQLKMKLEEITKQCRENVTMSEADEPTTSESDGPKKKKNYFKFLKFNSLRKTLKLKGPRNGGKVVEPSVAEQSTSSRNDGNGKKVSNAPSTDKL